MPCCKRILPSQRCRRFETVQLMLALAALENWHIESLDVCSTYLYGKLTKEIYMKQPEGLD